MGSKVQTWQPPRLMGGRKGLFQEAVILVKIGQWIVVFSSAGGDHISDQESVRTHVVSVNDPTIQVCQPANDERGTAFHGFHRQTFKTVAVKFRHAPGKTVGDIHLFCRKDGNAKMTTLDGNFTGAGGFFKGNNHAGWVEGDGGERADGHPLQLIVEPGGYNAHSTGPAAHN